MKKLPIGLLVIVTSVVYAQQPRPRSKRPIPTIAVTSPEGIPYVTLLSDDGIPVQLREDLTLLSESMVAQRERWKEERKWNVPFATDSLEAFLNALGSIRNLYATKDSFLAVNEEQKKKILSASPEAKVVILPDARATFTSLEPLRDSLRQLDLNDSIAILQIADYFVVPELLSVLPSIIAQKLSLSESLDLFAHQDVSFLDRFNVLSRSPQASQIAKDLFKDNPGAFFKSIITIPHDDMVKNATFSPDGTKVVTASWDKTAKIVDANTGRVIATIRHAGGVFSPGDVDNATFSPDGTKIVTASKDGTAKIVDANTGSLLAAIRHDSVIFDAAFSPDSTRVVTASNDHTAQISNATNGDPITLVQHGASVNTAAFSPDGTKVVTASNDHTAKISSATNGDLIFPPIQHGDGVNAAVFSPDGTKVVTTSSDRTAKIVDAITGNVIKTVPYESQFSRAAFSPDSTKFIIASSIFDARTGELLATLPYHNRITAAFSPDGTKIIIKDVGKVARIVDATTLKLLATIRHNEGVTSVAFSPDGTKVVTASGPANFKSPSDAKISSPFPEANKLPLPQTLFVILLDHLEDAGRTLTLNNELKKIWEQFSPHQKTFLRRAYPSFFTNLPQTVASLKKEKSHLKITQRKQQKKNIVAKAKIPTSISA